MAYELNDRYIADEGTVFLTGIQALARLPLEQLRADRLAGLHTAAFISGYQGSPLGGYGDAVVSAARLEPDLDVVYVPGMNEEYAATAVMGSQLAAARPDALYDGVVGIWHGKAPGVDRASDALRHAAFAGTSMSGGALAIVGDDPAAKSSTVPSSSAGVLADMSMPLLYPGDPTEALDLGRHGIALSRATGLWVALKIVADVADATASVQLHPERFSSIAPLLDGRPYVHQPDGRLLTPHTIEIEQEIIEVRYELARTYALENKLNHSPVDPADAWVGIVSSGITYREVREALARLGLREDAEVGSAGIRLLKLGMPIPFDANKMRRFSDGLERIIVVEEKHGSMESLIKDALYSLPNRPIVVGKRNEAGATLFREWGALDADAIIPALASELSERLGDRLTPQSPERRKIPIPLTINRAPYFCSGCPHNRSTQVPDGAVVGAGIGCHTMTLLMEEDCVGDISGITAMGNEGTQWIGMAPFVEQSHLFQNLGDGTFFHSGQLAIQAAVAAGAHVTYKLLYNGTVAMTGGQDPVGQLGVAEIASVLLTHGVTRIIVTTEDLDRHSADDFPASVEVWHRDRLIECQEVLAAEPGVTVLIHDQACAAETRRARKRGKAETPDLRVVINERICEGCGDCGDVSNCLSVQPVETPFGRKTQIDQTTCNYDYSCLGGDCPSFMTVRTKAPTLRSRLRSRIRLSDKKTTSGDASPHPSRSVPTLPVFDTAALPRPAATVPTDEFAMRICGIGGTGVVTVAQIIGTAAMLDGFDVRGLDQIGLSQKAGPVVSDVRMSRNGASFTNRLGERQADLLLALDQLVAASDKGLLTCDPERTVAVGSTSATPTGEMIVHPDRTLPSAESLSGRIGEHTRNGDVWADASDITTALFGSAQTANMFVVGMAAQAGALPIEPETIEHVIELNGVAVNANTAAFRWGRALVCDRSLVAEAGGFGESAPPDAATPAVQPDIDPQIHQAIEQLAELVVLDDPQREHLAMLATELSRWGSHKTTAEWFNEITAVARIDGEIEPQRSDLTLTFAAGLFKLMAYKDEYEVARLMQDSTAIEAASGVGARSSIGWMLHPPVLRAAGMKSKIRIPLWAGPGVGVLARGKRLRGTPVDPFGYAHVRKVERQLPGEYLAAVHSVLNHLTAENYDDAVRLASLTDIVCGYEEIKLSNVQRFREAIGGAVQQLTEGSL